MNGFDEIKTDLADIQDEYAGFRVGRRIREVRESHVPPMNQGDLGEAVGLPAPRIQQYETGARKPRTDLLKKIAEALGVEAVALADPVPMTTVGVMYTLFELERLYNLKPIVVDGRYCLAFARSTEKSYTSLQRDLKEWFEKLEGLEKDWLLADSKEERDSLYHEYKLWEWTYPKQSDNTLSNTEKLDRVKRRIAELQRKVAQLELLQALSDEMETIKNEQ